jgi:photosystem II stability/assembly factor-like uncharacterized protein
MTDDLIEQLRVRNPAPTQLLPPPIDDVLARIAAGERPSTPRWPRWVGPSVAIAVAVVVLVSVGGHRTQSATRPAKHAVSHGPTAPLRIGRVSAMRGSLQTPVLGFGSAGTGAIAWTQLARAGAHHATPWLATTNDGGRSWSVARRSFQLSSNPRFAGSRDGWAPGIAGGRIPRFYVTHDGGRSWAPAASAAVADAGDGGVSVAGAVVWAVGTGHCAGTRCRSIVMRGSASGDRLPATAAQPLAPTDQNGTTISAASATTAYVSQPARGGTAIYATHDGGRHWRRIPDSCAGGSTDFALTAPTATSLWQVCVRAKRFFVLRSTDGGTRWSRMPLPFIALFSFQAVTGQVAWSQDIHGTIWRTANGGASWRPVWHSSGGPYGRPRAGFSPILSPQSRDDASLLVQLTQGPTSHGRVPRSTSLVVYRTTDGGRSWDPHAVQLPRG